MYAGSLPQRKPAVRHSMLAAAETREGSFKALVLLSLLVVSVKRARLGEHALDTRLDDAGSMRLSDATIPITS